MPRVRALSMFAGLCFAGIALARQGGVTAATPEPASGPAPPVANAAVNLSIEQHFAGRFASSSGGLDTTRLRAGVDLFLPVAGEDKLNLGWMGEYDLYNFDPGPPGSTTDLGEPWRDLSGLRLSARYYHTIDERWTAYAGGGIEAMGEVGAKLTDAIDYTAIVGGRYAFSKDFSVGLALIGKSELEQGWTAYPVPSFDWQIDKNWSVGTIFSRGPGLGVEYQTDDQQFTVSLRCRYETRDARLAGDNAAAPGGVAIDRRVPLLLTLDWNMDHAISLSATAGVDLWGRIKLEDSGGTTLRQSDIHPTPFVGFSISLRY